MTKNGRILRRILIAMIVNDEFLSAFCHEIADMTFLEHNEFSKSVAKWCVGFYKKYEKAPKRHIQEIYDKAIRTKKMKRDQLELIESLLADLSNEYDSDEEIDVDFLLNEAKHLRKMEEFEELKQELTEALNKEDTKRAAELLKEQRIMLERDDIPLIHPLKDSLAIDKVFSSNEKPLFHLRGGLGELVDPYLTRDSFISVLAPEKRGKTFILLEFAMRAVVARNNVAFFQVGDMSDRQFLKRIYQWMSKKPVFKHNLGEMFIPELDCIHSQRDECPRPNGPQWGYQIADIEGNLLPDIPKDYKPCDICQIKNRPFPGTAFYKKHIADEVLTRRECMKWQKILSWRTKGRQFKLATYPNSTVSIGDIDGVLETWKRQENFIPDCIFIDYADILAPEDEFDRDQRAIENKRWKAMRKLSQEWNSFVMTATQAKRETYNSDMITMADQGEDKRKNAHITGQLALHQTNEEKRKGIIRIGWITLREGDFDIMKQAVCLQHLGTCNVNVDSYLIKYKRKAV